MLKTVTLHNAVKKGYKQYADLTISTEEIEDICCVKLSESDTTSISIEVYDIPDLVRALLLLYGETKI